MSNAPYQPAVTALRATTPWVSVASSATTPPTSGDVAIYLRPRVITRSAGNSELDTCRFDYNLNATGQRIQDVRLFADWNRQVAVALPTEFAPGGADVIYWGETIASQLRIRTGEESVTITAAVGPYLFGDINRGMPLPSAAEGTVVTPADWVFNPIIDGKVLPNKSTKTDGDYGFPLFVSPDSVRTTAAQASQFDSASLWTVREAVHMAMKFLNGAETWIINASDWAGDNTMFEDAPPLVNFRVRRGDYLPDVLDALLSPAGYSWFLDPGAIHARDDSTHAAFELYPDADWLVIPTIVLYKRGAGRNVGVYFQRVGEQLDMRLTNAPEINAELDILDLANAITGHGSWEEYEMTLELLKPWSYDDDELTPDDLDPNTEGSLYHDGKEHVWRRWVYNEAGDWNGTRDITFRSPLPFPAGNSTTRRRRLFPCLTHAGDDDSRRRPVYVEWYDNTLEEWREVPSSWGFEVLTDEIGIRFPNKIPSELWAEGAAARLRVTGVVVSDERLNSVSSTLGDSPNANDVELFLDLSDKFHYRSRIGDGQFRSRFHDTGLADEPLDGDSALTFINADEADDTSALQDYLDTFAGVEQAAKATAVITLDRLDWSYQIGDIVVGVVGREISFNRLTPGAGNGRWMQITAIVHDIERQQTRLKIQSEEAGPRI